MPKHHMDENVAGLHLANHGNTIVSSPLNTKETTQLRVWAAYKDQRPPSQKGGDTSAMMATMPEKWTMPEPARLRRPADNDDASAT